MGPRRGTSCAMSGSQRIVSLTVFGAQRILDREGGSPLLDLVFGLM
jgi:hypothetical protein